ncbi:hypothetical protein ACFLY9_02290 [Patescibacteria group bacterium]
MKKIVIAIFTIIISTVVFTSAAYAEGDGVVVPTEGDSWLDEVFGEGGLNLNIMKPLAFWDMEGTASIWSIAAMILNLIWPVLFIAFIVAVLVGVMKWMSSQGDETKLQSARKWIQNAIIGFVATGMIFVGANVATWWLGLGSVFSLSQNLAVCGDDVLYEYKKNTFGDAGADVECTCSEGAITWSCK